MHCFNHLEIAFIKINDICIHSIVNKQMNQFDSLMRKFLYLKSWIRVVIRNQNSSHKNSFRLNF